MGKGFRLGSAVAFLAVLCVLLFYLIDHRRALQIVFLLPQELNFRFTPAKPFLFSSLEKYFEENGAKVNLIVRTYRSGETVDPLLETLASDPSPKVLYWFGDLSELEDPGKLNLFSLIFPLYPVPLELSAAHPQMRALYGSMESFSKALQNLIKSEKPGHLIIIVDSHHAVLAETILEDLSVDFQWVPVEESIGWSLGREGTLDPAQSPETLFLFLCEPESVVRIVRSWKTLPRDRMILGPWSIPVDTLYTDTTKLAGIRFLSKPTLNESAASSLSEPVFPWVIYVVEASKAVFSGHPAGENSLAGEWYAGTERYFSLLLQEQRSAQPELGWNLWEYTGEGCQMKKCYNPLTADWEECP